MNRNKILMIAFFLSLLIIFSTPTNALKRVPENITTETINSLEILSDNSMKINFKFLHTNPTPNIKWIDLSDGLILHSLDIDISDISVKSKYLPELKYYIEKDYNKTDIVVDIDFIRIDYYDYNYVEIEYTVHNISIETEDTFLTERKTISYRSATLEEVNSYSHTLKIPKKPFPFYYILKLRLIDVLTPPDNSYETGRYYEFVWKLGKTSEKNVYVIPIRITYEYYWDIIVILEFIFGSIIIVIGVNFLYDKLPKLFKIFRKSKEEEHFAIAS